jgi:hypothetical protein
MDEEFTCAGLSHLRDPNKCFMFKIIYENGLAFGTKLVNAVQWK